MLTSLERVAYGFGLAAIVGIALGALIGQSIWMMRGLDPIFQVLRTVPPLAWLPIALAAFRDSGPSAVFVIFITAVWPVIINTAVGIRNIPQDYRNVAEVLRLNSVEYFWHIMLPAAAPFIFTGLRIGIGLSWLAIVAAEMLTGGVGIGLLHLGRVELLAPLRHHRSTRLHRHHRLRARPSGGVHRPPRNAWNRTELSQNRETLP